MPSSSEELLLLALLLKKKKRKRRMQTHKMLASRIGRGLHHTLYDDLRADESKFFNYFRMTKPTFDELLSHIEDDIRGTDTNMRRSIKPDEKLAVTLTSVLLRVPRARHNGFNREIRVRFPAEP